MAIDRRPVVLAGPALHEVGTIEQADLDVLNLPELRPRHVAAESKEKRSSPHCLHHPTAAFERQQNRKGCTVQVPGWLRPGCLTLGGFSRCPTIARKAVKNLATKRVVLRNVGVIEVVLGIMRHAKLFHNTP